MSLPGNGIFVVQGEMNMLVTAMRRSTRWGSHSFPNEEYDVLMRTFQDLKTILYQVDDLRLLDPPTYLGPFLEVIRSKETNGPVTSLALSAIHKFLSYGLIDPTHPSVPATVEDIADAVTHARFVGTDHSSDGVVLMKILQVLRTLMLSPEGVMLTDESVCEIMLSCFRICFESRLTELLRRNAEQCLRDMTQLIFMRLPQFPPDDAAATFPSPGLSLKKRDKPAKRRSLTTVNSTNSLEGKQSTAEPTPKVQAEPDAEDNKSDSIKLSQDRNLLNEEEITIEPTAGGGAKSPSKKHARHSSMDLAANENSSFTQLLEKCVSVDVDEEKQQLTPEETESEVPAETEGEASKLEEYVNPRGIRFTPHDDTDLQPYGLGCVRELFRFLISLSNPLEASNSGGMVHLGLALVGTALEVSADHVAAAPPLLHQLRDPLARNLLMLLNTERISIFALDLQVTFLLFESMRHHLKFQMEAYFKKIIEIISADTSKAPYELKEIHHLALESLIQFFKIPGFCAELYLNYDCDVYCMNMFEELTKLLSKNVVSSTAYDIHQLSLEALLTILEAIEIGSQSKDKSETEIAVVEEVKETKYGRGGHITLELGGMDECSVASDHVTHDISQYVGGSRRLRHRPPVDIPTEAELDNIKNMKKWVQQGTELFNQKPERGIEFLQEHGVLKTPLDPPEVATFLRENPDLDKKMIGEYICKRSSRGEEGEGGGGVLAAFADSFEYGGLRIDQALRLYLETFRLPGEAPLIFLVMERFAERWHSTNGEPFANTDAAFRLAYAVIMLNMDQHNHNAKKLNVPMTVEDFVKNLRGCNGAGDFDQAMLEQIYNAIKSEEMVMPAERTGLVREAYLWRVLQRRGATAAARYRHAHSAAHHATLFAIACPPIVSALCAAFERASPPTDSSSGASGSSALEAALGGLERAAALLARLPPDQLTLDSLILSLAKFTGLLACQHTSHVAIAVSLGGSPKALRALARVWAVGGRHAHVVRAAWAHLMHILTTLFLGRLLPRSLVEVEDYSSGGRVSLVREAARGPDGLLSSIYSYIALGDSGVRAPTPHEKALIDIATECVAKCNIPSLLITETKFLPVESLQELVKAIIAAGGPPDAEALQQNPQLEDVTIFYLELLGQVLIQNRDRVWCVWEVSFGHWQRTLQWAGSAGAGVSARVVCCTARVAGRLLRAHDAAPRALALLDLLLALPAPVFYHNAYVISCGIYELVKTSAQNLHSSGEWERVFAVLCAAGAGAWPLDRPNTVAVQSTSSPSSGSEDESERRPTSASSESELSHSPQTQGWIMVKKEAPLWGGGPGAGGGWGAVRMRGPSPAALARGAEALALVVRDVAHVTPHNAAPTVRALRLFAAAARGPGKKSKSSEGKSRGRSRRDDSSDEEVDTHDQFHIVSLQLLDLMHTLHSRTAQIFKWWKDEAEQDGTEDYDLWEVAWKPLLQGIAQFCTDRRKQISHSGVAYLQRALLAPGLTGVCGAGWEACFHDVLFPLLGALGAGAAAARPNTILCKVFLQHLAALAPRAAFPALWARVVHVQRALLAPHAHHATRDAARESLKNMLLVMDSVGIFGSGDEYNDLWYITWNTIDQFLPTLKDELFPDAKDRSRAGVAGPLQLPLPSSLPTLVPVAPPAPASPPSSPHSNPPVPIPAAAPPRPAAVSPVNISQSPPLTSGLVMPTAISGMVPIRNPLYDQAGLTSSVLLQPLNEMKSTPIGVSIQSQPPIVIPQAEPQPPKIGPSPAVIEPIPTVLEFNYDENMIVPDENVEQGELYAEYLTNPYNDSKLAPEEATLYDPENPKPSEEIRNPLLSVLDKQKSYSANTTPLHKNKAQFGSTDNVRQESSIFNFSSYFSGDKAPAAEMFDALITHEG